MLQYVADLTTSPTGDIYFPSYQSPFFMFGNSVLKLSAGSYSLSIVTHNVDLVCPDSIVMDPLDSDTVWVGDTCAHYLFKVNVVTGNYTMYPFTGLYAKQVGDSWI